MDAFPASEDDGGKLPVEKISQPANDCQRVRNVPFQLTSGPGLVTIEAVEVQHGKGPGMDVGSGAGKGAGSPCGWGGHRSHRIARGEPFSAALPPGGVAGLAGVVNVTGPQDGVRQEEAGQEVTRAGFHQGAVDPLRTILPHVRRFPCEALDQSPAVPAGGVGKVPLRLLAALLLRPALQVFPTLYGVRCEAVTDADKGGDPPSVFVVAGVGRAGEALIREDSQVVPGAVGSLFRAGGAACRHLAGRVMADLFKKGEVETWH